MIKNIFICFLCFIPFLLQGQICYQESFENSSIDRTITEVGIINNEKIFAEIISSNNGGGTSLNIVILRIDSSFIADYNICFEYLPDSTITVYKLNDGKEVSIKKD